MRYADEGAVLAQLSLDPDNEEDAAAIERVNALEEGLCLTLDEKIGTSFGEAPVPETRAVTAYGPPLAPLGIRMPYAEGEPRLVLTTALRSLTSIEVGGTWDGTVWVDGRTLDADEYRLTGGTRQGYYAIDRVSGTWSGVVRVTGVWADQVANDVPADIREAMTFIVAETYRQEKASPADELGPDGMMVRPRNPWNYEQVKMAIKRHKIVKVFV